MGIACEKDRSLPIKHNEGTSLGAVCEKYLLENHMLFEKSTVMLHLRDIRVIYTTVPQQKLLVNHQLP